MKNRKIVIYKTKSGNIEFRADIKTETLWATQAQMAVVFGVNPQAVTKHLKNIYREKELARSATCSKMEQVQKEGKRLVKRQVEVYNLDAIISVGYRISSKTGTKFRQWATRVLHDHVIDGYTLNKKRLGENYKSFLSAVDRMKGMLPEADGVRTVEALEIIKLFADTWFSLHAYDKGLFPESGASKKHVDLTADELSEALLKLKIAIIRKKEAGDLFGREKSSGALDGIVGNVFQSFDGKDLYSTIEEKAAHILYFIVKNHPFVDGNKRSGAFAFVWFLKKAGILDLSRFTPVALTALTLLIAESRPVDRDNMIGLILMLLKR
ncbi:MAG: virulence protein RhuM/Fic/DOC family protein [Desulfobacteraceae bacterium]|nr:virulence protein RhuM/Fic/DOC family protein [Desulfobacteraceae bacterium]